MGWNIKQSAIIVSIHYQYAFKIVQRYNEFGPETVLKKSVQSQEREHKGGKKPLLNEQQMEKLSQALEDRPSDGGIWTGPKVARWIEKARILMEKTQTTT